MTMINTLCIDLIHHQNREYLNFSTDSRLSHQHNWNACDSSTVFRSVHRAHIYMTYVILYTL